MSIAKTMVSRRGFMKSALAAGAFPFLPGCATFGRDKVRIACVGIGNRAAEVIGCLEHAGLFEMVALCDTDLEGPQCAKVLAKYPSLPRFTDFRKMLDAVAGRIDAVTVCTPDFSHFPALMDAMRRGLAVFSEKPLAHTFEECELLMAAERKYGVVTQMGNQGHSGKNYYQFRHYVETGVIDVSKLSRLVAHMNSPRRWHKWNGKVAAFPTGEAMPKGLDWDTWLGTAAWHEYSKDYVQGEWRSWYDFGNGCLGDWGAHTMDTMHRFFSLGLPSEVKIKDVSGWNPFVFPMQDTLVYTFPAAGRRPKIDLEWYEGRTNRPKFGKGYKMLVPGGAIPASGAGTGTVKGELPPGKYFTLSDGTAWEGTSHANPILMCGDSNEVPDYPFKDLPNDDPRLDHYVNFARAVMGQEPANSPFSVTAPLSEVFCLGCIAQRLNRGFKFDPVAKHVVGDEAAERLLKGSEGTPRRGWEEFYRV